MSYTVCDRRKQTMIARIGEAIDLIDDTRFLPFYRGIQIRLEKMGKPEEWARMIERAKSASNPKRYFATLCKRVKLGTYQYGEKLKEIGGETALFLHDKLVKFGFGAYQKYWVRKANEFINVNGMAGFVDLLEYAERKSVSQKYMARALANCKPPRKYYTENVRGNA